MKMSHLSALFLLGLVAGVGTPSVCRAETPCLTPKELAHMDACQLDALFAAGKVCEAPVGAGRGKVLLVVDALLPRLRARLMGSVWKGKYFYGDGRFTNQWVGFKAVEANITTGPSWVDGASCFILDYPSTAAVFGNSRDELREVAQGVFLGKFFERCPCPKLKGYFVLVFPPRRCSCR